MPIEKVCENCQQPFACFPSENRKYCGLACRSAHRFDKGIPAEGRAPVNFTCRECGKTFSMMKNFVTTYHKKYGRDPWYCSRQCSGVGRRKTSESGHTFTCLACGKINNKRRKPGGRLYEQQQYCGHACKVEGQKKKALHKFETGGYKKHTKRHGYVWLNIPELAQSQNGQRHIMEHRHVMSKHIGRELLPNETVHHINGIRGDNRIENLELFSSRHGPGQRVVDKVQFAIEILTLYPDFGRSAGYELHKIPH